MILENTVNATLIVGTPDNDSILNFGLDVTIDSGSGNDTIYSGLDDQKADRVSINAGEGNNVVSIQGGSVSVTIRTGHGNNLIGSTSPNNAVFSGAGNDSVVFYTGADNNTMETGDGDDVIDAVGHNVTINAGAGNDRIRTYRNAYDITIKGGTGDDEIILGGPVDSDHTNVVQYADGDGFDTITDFSATDTLQITSGNISGATLVGNNVEISVGSGKITLVEANNMNINIIDAEGNLNQTIFSGGSIDDTVVNDTVIVGTDGDDYLINDKGKNVTINALGGNDTIDNTGDNSIIEAGAGNDIVSVAGASFVTIRTDEGDNRVYIDNNGASEVVYFGEGSNTIVASNRNSTIIGGGGGNVVTLHNGSFGSYVESGSGNDTVAVGHYDITVDAGAGNDLINLYRDAENALIKMGEGNDTVMVYNNTHAQTFQYSGGNDIINGFDANDTLQIVGHAPSSSVVSDGNLILGLGDGSLTLAGVSSAESLNVEYVGKWSTLDGGGWEYYSVVQRDLLGNKRPDKAAQFSLSGGNLKDENEDGAPDNVSIGSIIYVQQSGVHTNVNHLSGNVIYNGDALGIEGDDDYNIEAISPIDTSEKSPYSTYITDPNVTAIRGVSNGATISPRGTAGTETAADWISIDSTDSKVTFMDGAYCVYTENKFSTRNYTKLSIANSNNGVEVSTADDLIQTISNLADGYEITIESGINVGEKINFETSGNGVVVVKTTANTGKYSLDADSDEWQYQRFSINGGGDDFTFVFGENGSVDGMEDFDGLLQTNDTSLIKGEWVTLEGGKFQYTGNALNNPSKYASFVVSGESLTSTDNLSIKRIIYMPAQDACRVELEGINGNATVDDVDLGISGDSLYTAHFTKINDQVLESTIVLMNVSDGATVESNYTAGVDSDGLITFSDGKHSVLTSDDVRGVVTSLEAGNGGDGFELNVSDDIFGTIGGLNDGYTMTINPGDNIGDELTFKTDGGNGTIIAGDKTLTVSGDKNFSITFDSDGNIAGRKNVKGSSVLITNAGEEDTTMLGGDGNDLLAAGTAVNTTMTGGKGSDTFRGGASLESALITDYTEGEDVIYHGRPFEDLSINGYISGKDYIFDVNGRTITIKNGANKIIEVVDAEGETRFFGKYLTLDDNDPATVNAEDGVETIDATRRTEDIVINGNSGNNTIISSSGDCTLYGGGGKNTFVRGNRTAEQIITVADYTEGEDEVYHERPFSAFSLLSVAKSVGDDYIFGTSTAMSRYTGGANKKIKFVDVNGNVAYFGNYITIMDVDSATVEATEKVKVLDATERTKAINLTGNSLDNTIYSGTGNDTLTGNDGSDLFAYSSGNDIITDYTEDDKISLGAAVSSSLISDAAAILTTNAGTLTIQNADGKTLNLIDSSGKEFSIKASSATQIINDVTAQASSVENISTETTTTLESGEAAIIAKTSAPVNITAGDNTIVSQGENVHVSLTGGNTRIFPLEGRMTLEGYDEATGSGFGTTYTNISSAVENGRIDFANGTLALGSAQVDMGTNSALMNFYNRNGRQQKVGYASQNDSLDASGKTDDLLLVAKQNGSITGGSGDDTILASEGSYVDGGAGKNLVKSNGATVALNGRTTVQGAVDTVYIAGADPSVDFKAGGLSLYDDAGKSLTFSGVHSTKKMNLYYADSNTLGEHVFIADDDWYNVADGGAADYYVGATASKNHGIDFSGVSEALDVTLNTDYAADTTFWINNIHSIRGGAGSTKITGSDKNDTILAGTGETSIYGGAGHDKMFGNTSENKNAAEFFYTAGDGRDSISNFGFITDAQDATADKVQLNDSGVSEVFLRGSDVMIKVDNADGFLMLENAQGKSFRLNDDLIAKVDKNVSFDGFSNCYVGIGTQATLTVGKGLGDVEVWLSDDSLEYHGKMYDGNFAVLDASQSDGRNILAGNELSNVITGGSGENSMWGGYSSENDTLIGGAGKNTFFYGAGNGHDVIRNAHDGDVISLEDITLEQITEANITASGVVLNFNDGGSLLVESTADVTYQLSDGSTYSVDRTNREFR